MKKIAVFLPSKYKGGSLRGAKMVAKSIATAAKQLNDDVEVVFSYVGEGGYDVSEDFGDLLDLGIHLRETRWEVLNEKKISQFSVPVMLDRLTGPLKYEQYCYPLDGTNDFHDCDLWVIISDRLPAPVLPVKKYVSLVYDYIQRYVPDIFPGEDLWQLQEKSFFPVVRNAQRVLVTSPSTLEDVVGYAGVARDRVRLLPVNFEPPQAISGIDNPFQNINNYFIWVTNTSNHKNHPNAIKALEVYYNELGGGLDVLVTGYWTEYLDPVTTLPASSDIPYIKYCRELLRTMPNTLKRMHFNGTLPEQSYAQAIGQSKFLWHPARYDNGSYSVVEAAFLGRPSLSARYPAMEHMDREFGLHLPFFDPNSIRAMARALKEMEGNFMKIDLPDQEALSSHSWQSNAHILYKSIIEII